jgi:hypothetical protein
MGPGQRQTACHYILHKNNPVIANRVRGVRNPSFPLADPHESLFTAHLLCYNF